MSSARTTAKPRDLLIGNFNTIQHHPNGAVPRDFVKQNINSAGYGFASPKETFTNEVPLDMQIAYRDIQRNL
jgi:hypothetical protein